MDNNENKILVPESENKKEKISLKDPKKLIILILIVIISMLFLIIIIILINLKKSTIINDNNFTSNRNVINRRLFLVKEDANSSIKTGKENIHIVMNTDNNGIYTTLVSMTSALENNDKNKNILIYHVLLSNGFNMDKIEVFESLKEKYDFRINYYKIPNLFKALRKWGLSNTIYYKLYISMIFPDFDRIIFLDSDTLIFKDIAEMYYLPFNDNYILGYPFHTPWILKRFFKIYPENYINVGVILINIKKIREDNKDFELIDFTFKNTKKLFFPEQDGMNYIFYKKIGLLPLKYGIYLYGNITEFHKEYGYKLKVKLNLTELEEAINDPSIVHLCCCNPKVWYKKSKHENHFNHICKEYQEKFYFYANKTKYYNDIYNKYMN